MASVILNQLAILLWKSWIMRRRHWLSTIFELFVPLVLAFLVCYLYAAANPSSKPMNSADDMKRDNNDHNNQYLGPIIYNAPTLDIRFQLHSDSDSYSDNSGFNLASIYYAPPNHFTNDLMKMVESFKYYSRIYLQPLSNGEEVNSKMESLASNRSNLFTISTFGIIFDVNDGTVETPDKFHYTIRMIGDMASRVNTLFPVKFQSGPVGNNSNNAYEQHFCVIQSLINTAYFNKQMESKNFNTKISELSAFKFPYPQYLSRGSEGEMFSLQDFIAATIVIGYVIMCPLIVKRITDEKVAKAKELLRMMGMSDWVFWGSHFINYFTVMLFHVIVFTLLYFVGIKGIPIMNYSDGCLFFVVIAVYCAQSILFCMLITTVFNRPVLAVVVTVIVWIVTYGVPFGLLNPAFHKGMNIMETNPNRLLSSLLPNMGLSWCLAIFGQFEISSLGATWTRLYAETSLYRNLTLGSVMLMMLFACFLYAVLIWYIDSVWPWQYGVPKPVYFPFTASYWFPKSTSNGDTKDNNYKELLKFDSKNFERETANSSTIGIRIQELRKEFTGIGSKRKVAVENVSLNIYRNQITVLLGHNGAGKTTTMNMITGIFPPTSGTVLVDGFNIITETNNARKSLGLCPQENIIYNELTVAQHLKLYAILKGYSWNGVNQEIDKTLKALQLTDKKNCLAVSLSGGMKRKLSLGIAMIGETKILILDEPTSGMDPEARRVVWDLLQDLRAERTILLTTHYMEEADVLGDRIAIMSEGLIKCCGSSMFLKKRFGAGYHLRIAKGNNYSTELVEQLLRKYLPKAQLNSEIHSEVIYSLDNNNNNRLVRANSITAEEKDRTSAVLANLFDDIERNKEKLGIASCGLTITTMEDVFLRVGNEFETNDDNDKFVRTAKKNGNNESSCDNLLIRSSEQLTGFDLLKNRCIGLLIKRFHFAKRYLPMIVFQLLVPGFLFIVVLLTDYSIRGTITGETKNLRLDIKELYGSTNGFIRIEDTITSIEDIKKTYASIAHKQSLNAEDIAVNPNEWALRHAHNLDDYSKHYLIGAEINKTEDNVFKLFPWYNNEASHSLPLSINLLFEALINCLIPEKSGQISITVDNYPVVEGRVELTYMTIISGWIVSCLLLTPITVPFIAASYILFPINERVSKSKLLQLMTGLSSCTFWLCNLLFDLINHLLAVIFIFIIFIIFDFNKVYFGQLNTAIGLFLMLFLFGFASIPLAYCLSLWFKKPSTGFAVLVIIYLLFGLIAIVALAPMDLALNVLHAPVISESVLNTVIGVFRLVPVFSMSFGIQKLYRIGSFGQLCRNIIPEMKVMGMCVNISRSNMMYGCCKDACEPNNECYDSQNPLLFDNNGVGAEFVYLVVDGFIFMTILMLLEGNIGRRIYTLITQQKLKSVKNNTGVTLVSVDETLPPTEDSDVLAERQRVENLRDSNLLREDALSVIDLTKYFTSLKLSGKVSFTAVDHLTFGVHKEECFGLLGVNGAGKTTTFSMLTGDLFMSAGNASIGDYNLRTDLKQFQKQIGYCPQFDALLEKLTAREMLYLFARLRGVPSNMIAGEVQSLIEMCDLQNHADRCTETYSGGNRRKLSLALAIIGTPPVIFLDEPTAGVDPAARRKIWATLVYIQEKFQSAIVLTSHSMEECEALCSRIAIMVNGKFKCFGSTQHLRTKFGQGFTVVIKLKRELNDDPIYVTSVEQHIQRTLPSAVLKDRHQCLLHYHITDTTVLWSHLFRVMETARGQLQFEDYLVSDTTLEQIFLAFARSQREF